MQNQLDIINIDKDWFETNIKEDNYYDLIHQYTQLSAKYYHVIFHESIIYPHIFTFGNSFTYLNMSIIYRIDTKKYYLFEYCVDSDKFMYLSNPKTWPIIFDKSLNEIQIVTQKSMLTMIRTII